jgi:hypothetical protein
VLVVKVMRNVIAAWVVGVLGIYNVQGAYLMAVNEYYDDQNEQQFSLNAFEAGTGELYATFSGALPAELDNIVQKDVNTFYGWLGADNGSSSTLYEFVLNGDTVSSSSIGSYSGVGQFDSVAVVGDTLYGWAHYGEYTETYTTWWGRERTVTVTDAGLYSIDLSNPDSEATRVLSASELYNVESMTYDDINNTLYLSDYKYFDGQSTTADSYLYAIDLDDDTLDATYVGTMDITDPEGMAVAVDGTLYVAAGSTLYTVDASNAQTLGSISLGWATTIEGMTRFSAGIIAVPEPGSALAWLLMIGGGMYVKRRRCLA